MAWSRFLISGWPSWLAPAQLGPKILWRRSASPSREWCWGLWVTCHRSRCADKPWTIAAISSAWALSFTRCSPESALNGLSDIEILVANPENGPAQKLARISGSHLSSGGLLMQPVLSPDGKGLAVLLTDGPPTDIWVQPTAGGAIRPVPHFPHRTARI